MRYKYRGIIYCDSVIVADNSPEAQKEAEAQIEEKAKTINGNVDRLDLLKVYDDEPQKEEYENSEN